MRRKRPARRRAVRSRRNISASKKSTKKTTLTERLLGEAQAAAVRFQSFHEKKTEKKIDLSLDSIRSLDHFLYRNAIRGLMEDGDVEDMGWFLAEVIRSAYGGRYMRDPAMKTMTLKVEGISVYPLARVRRAVDKIEREGVKKDAFTFKHTGPLEGYLYNLGRKLLGARTKKNENNQEK